MAPSTFIKLNWVPRYALISSNKIILKYYLVFALSGLGVTTMCQEQKGDSGTKKFEKHWPRAMVPN